MRGCEFSQYFGHISELGPNTKENEPSVLGVNPKRLNTIFLGLGTKRFKISLLRLLWAHSWASAPKKTLSIPSELTFGTFLGMGTEGSK